MDDQVTLSIGGFVDHAVGHDDAAKMHALEHAQELVMVAGDIGYARAFTSLAQQLLDNIVVGLWPVP